MRILYSIVILTLSVAFTVSGQTREDYDAQQSTLDIKSVHLFPNPAVDYVHVRFERIPARQVVLSVHNIIGNEVKVETEIVDEHEVRVRVKELTSGYYLLAVKDLEDHFQGTYKFLKR